MNGSQRQVLAKAGIFLWFALIAAASTSAQAPTGIVEVVPTARRDAVEWRYTTERPRAEWRRGGFDDSGWKTAAAPFATPITPGIRVGTTWDTADIWLRRKVTLPAELKDPACIQLMVFHDEDVEIYLNGALAAREAGFITEYEPMEILPEAAKALKPGAKVLIAVHCHQVSGGQGIDVGLAAVPPGYTSDAAIARRKEQLRGYAMSHQGNAAAGRSLFANEQRLACSKCHGVDGKGVHAGPDLMSVGDKFPRGELIDAILHPSATIAVGYSTTILRMKGGDIIEGIIKEATDSQLSLMGADGKMIQVPAADVQSRRVTTVSLMPEGLEAGLSAEEFTNLIDYLAALRVPESAEANRQGMPANIPELKSPVALLPLHGDGERFNHPCYIGQIPGKPGSFLVAEHETGKVFLLKPSASGATKTLWGDFGKEIHGGGATGLLGIAFHPRFAENHKYFIQHEVMDGGQMHARVSEKFAADDLTKDSGKPSRLIFDVACTTDVHSGGGIEFGPDGMLYVAMGDTGPQGDPQGHGQNLTLPLGKMMRVDVDHEADGKAYAIPSDNPFRDRAGVRPEIWAYGFREPWRFSFDSANGDLWVGDVGQDRIEEVDVVRRGENYGWNVYEGFDPFSNRARSDGATYVWPVFAYNRRLGNSITGGYVYRPTVGTSPFAGLYICGDYNSKRIWALQQSDRKLTNIWQIGMLPERLASFGRDEKGELYAVGYEGTIFRLDFGKAKLEATHEK